MNNTGKAFKMNNGKVVIVQRVIRKDYELCCNQCYFFRKDRSCILIRADVFKGMNKQFTKDTSTFRTFVDHIVVPDCHDGDKLTSVFKLVDGGV